MDSLIYMAVVLALGKLSRQVPVFPENTPQALNQFVIWISFPATVLLKLNGLVFDPSLLVLVLVPWALVILAVGAVLVISRGLGWDSRLTGGVMLAAALGNTSFFGFPAVTAFLGEDYLKYAILYDQFGSFLALAVFGTIAASIFSQGARASLGGILLKIIGFPPFTALVLGICLSGTSFPDSLVYMLEGLSATLLPLVMFSVGAQLKFRQPLSNIYPILITMGLKMVAFPIIVMAALLVLGVSGPVFQVAVFESAMPSMVMAGVLASSANLRPEVANAAVGYGILFSFVSLPLVHWLIRLF